MALDIIQQESHISLVRDAVGAKGWIDNSYLIKTDPLDEKIPSTQKINTLENRLDAAQQPIRALDSTSLQS